MSPTFVSDRRATFWCALMLGALLPLSPALAQTDSARTQAPTGGTQAATAGAQAPVASGSKFISPDDGWLDLSGFMDTKFGFMPIGTIITEPAVGVGFAGGLAFVSEPPAGRNRPDMTVVGGAGTSNGTKGAVAGDLHHWFGGRLQTLAAVVGASINLDYYGLGDDSALASNPLRYNLEPVGVLAQAKYRLGGSAVFAGLRYSYAQTKVAFDAPEGAPGLPDFRSTSNVGGLAPLLTFDSRDNLFTPTRGTYVDGSIGFFSDVFGGDDDFQTAEIVGIHYVALPKRVFLGARGEFSSSSDDTPFYLRPFIQQRGVPAVRYQGEEMAQVEGEVRWQFWNRLSAVGFAGAGSAWTGFEQVDNPTTAVAGGGGFRYELARRYGIHVGLDIAYGPDGAAYYVQWGSAWARP